MPYIGGVFKIAKQIVGKLRDITGKQCVRNDHGNMIVENSEIRKVWKEH